MFYKNIRLIFLLSPLLQIFSLVCMNDNSFTEAPEDDSMALIAQSMVEKKESCTCGFNTELQEVLLQHLLQCDHYFNFLISNYVLLADDKVNAVNAQSMHGLQNLDDSNFQTQAVIEDLFETIMPLEEVSTVEIPDKKRKHNFKSTEDKRQKCVKKIDEEALTNEEKIRIIEQSGCLEPKFTECACGKNFESYDQLTDHVRATHVLKEENYGSIKTYYICQACEKTPNSSIHRMCNHYRIHAEQKCNHACPFCYGIYSNPNSLRTHLAKHHNVTFAKKSNVRTTSSISKSQADSNIQLLQPEYNNESTLGLNLNIDNVLEAFETQKSAEIVNEQNPLTMEEKIRIIEQTGCLEPKLSRCSCGEDFAYYYQLVLHVRKDHAIYEKVNDRVRTYYICKACPMIPNSAVDRVCSHYKVHTNQVCIHECPLCHSKHPSSVSLRNHLKYHHDVVFPKKTSIKTMNSENDSQPYSNIELVQPAYNNSESNLDSPISELEYYELLEALNNDCGNIDFLQK